MLYFLFFLNCVLDALVCERVCACNLFTFENVHMNKEFRMHSLTLLSSPFLLLVTSHLKVESREQKFLLGVVGIPLLRTIF